MNIKKRIGFRLSSSRGFTLIEMLVQIAIFVTIAGFLVTITFVALRVRNQELAATEVSGQLNFVMHTVQRLIRESAAASVTGTSTLTLTRPDPNNPTIVQQSGTAITLKEGVGAATPITSNQVEVSSLTFAKIVTPLAPDVIQIEMAFRYNTQNIFASTTRTLRSSASPLNQ